MRVRAMESWNCVVRAERNVIAREEWEETLYMRVRRIRVIGDSATVTVVSLGDKPSHKKKSHTVQSQASYTNEHAVVARSVVCGGCGNRHQCDDNFCRSCGQKRGWASEAAVNLVKAKQAKVNIG